MFKPKLVVTTRCLPAVEERLEREFDVRRETSGRAMSSVELLALADGADAMFTTPMDRLDAAFFERLSKSVKVISTYSVGLDHIDLKSAAARNISVGYTPGAITDATAEIAMPFVLGSARRACCRGLSYRRSSTDPEIVAIRSNVENYIFLLVGQMKDSLAVPALCNWRLSSR